MSVTQWIPGQVLSFFSQMSPVSLSVTVPSPLSTKRRVVVVVLVVVLVVVVLLVGVVLLVVVDVLVLVVVVGVAHSPAVQAPLQHWLFAVQVARFGLQLALLGAAPALRGVPTRSARAANIAAKPPRARCDMCCTSRGTGATGEAVVVPPPSCAQEPRTIGGWASRSREGSVGVADALGLHQAAPAACRHLEQGVSLSGSAAPAAAAARPAGAIAVPPAAYHHAQPPRSLGACSTAAPGLRSCACAAVLVLVERIGDAEAATMAEHLRECHPELRLGATVGVGDVLDNYRVTPTCG